MEASLHFLFLYGLPPANPYGPVRIAWTGGVTQRAPSVVPSHPIEALCAHRLGDRLLGTPGELIVYEDAYRTLAVAINRGDAAATLGLRPDAEVRLRPR